MAYCPVDAVIWIFTGACNLNCIHCYAVKWRGKPELTLEEKLRLANEIGECGIDYVNISGGEPLIHPHLRPVLDRLREFGVESSLVTNGVSLTRDTARYLARNEVYVFLSLDGPKAAHEAHRGPGTFDRVVEAAKTLREAGVRFSTVMAVSRLNWRFTREYVELAVSLGAERPILIPVMPFGSAVKNRVYVGHREYADAVRAAAERAKELGVKLQLWCTPFAPLILPREYWGIVSWSYCRYAPVVDIDPQGNLLLCDVMDIVIGSVRGRKLSQAIREAENHPLVREVFEPRKLNPVCKSCVYADTCMGGCFARAYAVYGGLNEGDPLCPRVAEARRDRVGFSPLH